MDSKTAAPATGATIQDTSHNNITVKLSPTQKRIVKLLLIAPHLSFDVEAKAYCRYAADNIQHIRNRGIDVITTMVDYVRKDGKNVKVGKYSIAPWSINLARQSVYGA